MIEPSTPNPKQLLLAMVQQRYLNRDILRKMFDSKVMTCWQYDTSNPALIMNRRKLDWSWSPWIKYRWLPFLTIKKETVKTYNKPWTIMKEKYLYLNFNMRRRNRFPKFSWWCFWEIQCSVNSVSAVYEKSDTGTYTNNSSEYYISLRQWYSI